MLERVRERGLTPADPEVHLGEAGCPGDAGPGQREAGKMMERPEHEGAAGGCMEVRASASDREHAIDVLKTAFAEERLTREEFDARVGRAFAARTCADLAALSADLPASAGALSSQAVASPTSFPAVQASRTNPLAVASLACGLIPVLPATVAAIALGCRARRQIRRTGERGAALASTGLALAALWIVLTLIVLVALR